MTTQLLGLPATKHCKHCRTNYNTTKNYCLTIDVDPVTGVESKCGQPLHKGELAK